MTPNSYRLEPGSWLMSAAATGERCFTPPPHITALTPDGPSSRASQTPFMRFGATRLLSGKEDDSSNICNDGQTSYFNQLVSTLGVSPSCSGSTHRQPKTSRRETHLLSAETWSIGEGEMPVDAKEMASSGEERAEEEEEKKEVVTTAVSSGIGLWASRGMLAAVAMLYGTEFGCVKLLQETVPMSLVAALRFTVAVMLFLPFLVKTNLGVFRAGFEVIVSGIAHLLTGMSIPTPSKIGLFDAVGFWAQSKSLITTTASKSAFICSLSVIFVPLIDAVLGSADGEGAAAANTTEMAEKKRQGVVFPTFNGHWIPALLAVAGVAFLELIGAESRPNSGDVWALGQPLCFGMGLRLTERSARNYPGDTLGIVAAHLLTVAVLAIGWCALEKQIPGTFENLHNIVIPSSGSLTVPLSLLWTGLMTISLPMFLEALAMEKVSATESTVIFSTQPIWGTVFAAVLLGETIGWNTGIGATLIVLACTWSSVGPTNQSNVLSFIIGARVRETSAG